MFYFFYFLFFIFSNETYTYDHIHLVKINTSINPASVKFISESIDVANSDKYAKLFVIELNTPGGLLSSTRYLVQKILGSKVPIAVNVSPSGAHAGSAGVMITLSAHIAAMAPGTNIGAAYPVSLIPTANRNTNDRSSEDTSKGASDMNKENKSKDFGKEKTINDLLAFVESIAVSRGRNASWAKESILNNATLIPEEALKKNVIDFIVLDTFELIEKLKNYKYIDIDKKEKTISIDKPKIILKEMSFKERFINFFADPNFAFFFNDNSSNWYLYRVFKSWLDFARCFWWY
jgi:membrane-bound serine protease (ClpP class)